MQLNPMRKLVFWIIWGTILVFIPFTQVFLGGGFPKGEDFGPPPSEFLTLALATIVASTFIRWYLLPRAPTAQKQLTTMVVGIALAESAQFFQLFLIGRNYPETQTVIFLLSLVGVAQFAPVYVKLEPESRTE